MQTEKRHSYGVLPVLKDGGAYKFLLVNQKETKQDMRPGEEHWTFAKGTPERNETSQETAVRETAEEVGIFFKEISIEPSFTSAYHYKSHGRDIDKQVTYFLGFTDSADFTVDGNEILEACWMSYEEAREKLTFEHSKQLLDDVMTYLQNLDK